MLEVNGENRPCREGQTLGHLLKELAIDPKRVVVEHNGTIPAPADWEGLVLQPGDRLEIVRFIGGG